MQLLEIESIWIFEHFKYDCYQQIHYQNKPSTSKLNYTKTNLNTVSVFPLYKCAIQNIYIYWIPNTPECEHSHLHLLSYANISIIKTFGMRLAFCIWSEIQISITGGFKNLRLKKKNFYAQLSRRSL